MRGGDRPDSAIGAILAYQQLDGGGHAVSLVGGRKRQQHAAAIAEGLRMLGEGSRFGRRRAMPVNTGAAQGRRQVTVDPGAIGGCMGDEQVVLGKTLLHHMKLPRLDRLAIDGRCQRARRIYSQRVQPHPPPQLTGFALFLVNPYRLPLGNSCGRSRCPHAGRGQHRRRGHRSAGAGNPQRHSGRGSPGATGRSWRCLVQADDQ